VVYVALRGAGSEMAQTQYVKEKYINVKFPGQFYYLISKEILPEVSMLSGTGTSSPCFLGQFHLSLHVFYLYE